MQTSQQQRHVIIYSSAGKPTIVNCPDLEGYHKPDIQEGINAGKHVYCPACNTYLTLWIPLEEVLNGSNVHAV